MSARRVWRAAVLTIEGPKGKSEVDGHTCGAALIITPNVNSYRRAGQAKPDPGFVITHAPSGRVLWPNVLTLTRAKQLCTALLQLDGWDRPWQEAVNDTALRARAEAIAREYL